MKNHRVISFGIFFSIISAIAHGLGPKEEISHHFLSGEQWNEEISGGRPLTESTSFTRESLSLEDAENNETLKNGLDWSLKSHPQNKEIDESYDYSDDPVDDYSQSNVLGDDFDDDSHPTDDYEYDYDETEETPSDPEYNNRGPREEKNVIPKWRLEDSIPGVPEADYPVYVTLPRTSFKCESNPDPGFYGDVEARCQVFHICQEDGRHHSFLCPVGTIFNQKHFVCDWWFRFNCTDTPRYFQLNSLLYKTEEKDNLHKRRHSDFQRNVRNQMNKMNQLMNGKRMGITRGRRMFRSNTPETVTQLDDFRYGPGNWGETTTEYRKKTDTTPSTKSDMGLGMERLYGKGRVVLIRRPQSSNRNYNFIAEKLVGKDPHHTMLTLDPSSATVSYLNVTSSYADVNNSAFQETSNHNFTASVAEFLNLEGAKGNDTTHFLYYMNTMEGAEDSSEKSLLYMTTLFDTYAPYTEFDIQSINENDTTLFSESDLDLSAMSTEAVNNPQKNGTAETKESNTEKYFSEALPQENPEISDGKIINLENNWATTDVSLLSTGKEEFEMDTSQNISLNSELNVTEKSHDPISSSAEIRNLDIPSMVDASSDNIGDSAVMLKNQENFNSKLKRQRMRMAKMMPNNFNHTLKRKMIRKKRPEWKRMSLFRTKNMRKPDKESFYSEMFPRMFQQVKVRRNYWNNLRRNGAMRNSSYISPRSRMLYRRMGLSRMKVADLNMTNYQKVRRSDFEINKPSNNTSHFQDTAKIRFVKLIRNRADQEDYEINADRNTPEMNEKAFSSINLPTALPEINVTLQEQKMLEDYHKRKIMVRDDTKTTVIPDVKTHRDSTVNLDERQQFTDEPQYVRENSALNREEVAKDVIDDDKHQGVKCGLKCIQVLHDLLKIAAGEDDVNDTHHVQNEKMTEPDLNSHVSSKENNDPDAVNTFYISPMEFNDSDEGKCDENPDVMVGSVNGFSVIIDSGSITREKTVKIRKCKLPTNRDNTNSEGISEPLAKSNGDISFNEKRTFNLAKQAYDSEGSVSKTYELPNAEKIVFDPISISEPHNNRSEPDNKFSGEGSVYKIRNADLIEQIISAISARALVWPKEENSSQQQIFSNSKKPVESGSLSDYLNEHSGQWSLDASDNVPKASIDYKDKMPIPISGSQEEFYRFYSKVNANNHAGITNGETNLSSFRNMSVKSPSLDGGSILYLSESNKDDFMLDAKNQQLKFLQSDPIGNSRHLSMNPNTREQTSLTRDMPSKLSLDEIDETLRESFDIKTAKLFHSPNNSTNRFSSGVEYTMRDRTMNESIDNNENIYSNSGNNEELSSDSNLKKSWISDSKDLSGHWSNPKELKPNWASQSVMQEDRSSNSKNLRNEWSSDFSIPRHDSSSNLNDRKRDSSIESNPSNEDWRYQDSGLKAKSPSTSGRSKTGILPDARVSQQDWSSSSAKTKHGWSSAPVDTLQGWSSNDGKSVQDWTSDSRLPRRDWTSEDIDSENDWSASPKETKQDWATSNIDPKYDWSTNMEKSKNDWSSDTSKSKQDWSLSAGKSKQDWSLDSRASRQDWNIDTKTSKRDWSFSSSKSKQDWASSSKKTQGDWLSDTDSQTAEQGWFHDGQASRKDSVAASSNSQQNWQTKSWQKKQSWSSDSQTPQDWRLPSNDDTRDWSTDSRRSKVDWATDSKDISQDWSSSDGSSKSKNGDRSWPSDSKSDDGDRSPDSRSDKTDWSDFPTRKRDWPDPKTSKRDWSVSQTNKRDWSDSEANKKDWSDSQTSTKDWSDSPTRKSDWSDPQTSKRDWSDSQARKRDWSDSQTSKRDRPDFQANKRDWQSDKSDWSSDFKNDMKDWSFDTRNDRSDWSSDSRNDRSNWSFDSSPNKRDWSSDSGTGRTDWSSGPQTDRKDWSSDLQTRKRDRPFDSKARGKDWSSDSQTDKKDWSSDPSTASRDWTSGPLDSKRSKSPDYSKSQRDRPGSKQQDWSSRSKGSNRDSDSDDSRQKWSSVTQRTKPDSVPGSKGLKQDWVTNSKGFSQDWSSDSTQAPQSWSSDSKTVTQRDSTTAQKHWSRDAPKESQTWKLDSSRRSRTDPKGVKKDGRSDLSKNTPSRWSPDSQGGSQSWASGRRGDQDWSTSDQSNRDSASDMTPRKVWDSTSGGAKKQDRSWDSWSPDSSAKGKPLPVPPREPKGSAKPPSLWKGSGPGLSKDMTPKGEWKMSDSNTWKSPMSQTSSNDDARSSQKGRQGWSDDKVNEKGSRKPNRMSSKGDVDSRTSWDSGKDDVKNIRWSTQIGEDGKLANGWKPITGKPRQKLNASVSDSWSKNISDNSDNVNKDAKTKAWGQPAMITVKKENGASDQISSDRSISSEESVKVLHWVPSARQNSPKAFRSNSRIVKRRESGEGTEKWSARFELGKEPSSGWIPILNIKNYHQRGGNETDLDTVAKKMISADLNKNSDNTKKLPDSLILDKRLVFTSTISLIKPNITELVNEDTGENISNIYSAVPDIKSIGQEVFNARHVPSALRVWRIANNADANFSSANSSESQDSDQTSNALENRTLKVIPFSSIRPHLEEISKVRASIQGENASSSSFSVPLNAADIWSGRPYVLELTNASRVTLNNTVSENLNDNLKDEPLHLQQDTSEADYYTQRLVGAVRYGSKRETASSPYVHWGKKSVETPEAVSFSISDGRFFPRGTIFSATNDEYAKNSEDNTKSIGTLKLDILDIANTKTLLKSNGNLSHSKNAESIIFQDPKEKSVNPNKVLNRNEKLDVANVQDGIIPQYLSTKSRSRIRDSEAEENEQEGASKHKNRTNAGDAVSFRNIRIFPNKIKNSTNAYNESHISSPVNEEIIKALNVSIQELETEDDKPRMPNLEQSGISSDIPTQKSANATKHKITHTKYSLLRNPPTKFFTRRDNINETYANDPTQHRIANKKYIVSKTINVKSKLPLFSKSRSDTRVGSFQLHVN